MARTFTIKAGSFALDHMKKKGLSPGDISVIPAAAGGPKWIALYAFDKYLLSNWFHERQTPLHLVGASAGAWRMLCYTLPDSLDAMDRFLKGYVEQWYEVKPTPEELTHMLEGLLSDILGERGANSLLEEKMERLYVISTQTRFRKKKNSQYRRSFLKIALKNSVSRKWLQSEVDRIVFTNSGHQNLIIDDGFKTTYLPFTDENMVSALRSTGTIPMMMNPVDGVGTVPGLFWDGALIDYHIGLDYQSDGLIFYPHFSDRIIEGWFDKFLPWRKFQDKVLDRMILVTPSKAFIDSWPDSKLPDRKDFETYFSDNDRRISNWYEVAARGKEMAEEFHAYWQSGKLLDIVQPI